MAYESIRMRMKNKCIRINFNTVDILYESHTNQNKLNTTNDFKCFKFSIRISIRILYESHESYANSYRNVTNLRNLHTNIRMSIRSFRMFLNVF